jgi:hypothetical protein
MLLNTKKIEDRGLALMYVVFICQGNEEEYLESEWDGIAYAEPCCRARYF